MAALPREGPAHGLVPVLAAVFAVTAVVADPGTWWQQAALLVAVAAYAAWHLRPRRVPVAVLAVVVVLAVGASQWDGHLELGLFLISLLAMVGAAWEPSRTITVAVVAVCVLVPAAVAALRPDEDIAWAPWTGGVVFPAVMGWSIRRQERLTHELARAHRELAEHAVLDERRRIAREVHDLVGHGLAAVLLQVTSARHVLRRSPDSADEALRSAEEVGRRSLQDLRRTIGLLRDDDGTTEDTGNASLPGAAHVGALVESFRGAGMEVGYDVQGPVEAVDPVVGLTLYRIVQESLSNVAKHAPGSRVTVGLVAGRSTVTVEVLSDGPATREGPPGTEAEGHFGLRGMRERAEVVGGRLTAGPTGSGWLVRCEVPRATAQVGQP